ncbi:hypothetical protein PAMA_001710 [Pampus argenteus]
MAVAQVPFLAAVLLLVSSGLHCSSTQPACPESCTCQRASLLNCSSSGLSVVPQHIQDSVSELDLSHNFLNFVTLHQPHYNLRNVWLENNSITHLSLCIERDPRSQYVRGLDGSESLQVLQLSFNRISTLQPRVLSNLRKLKELHLQHNLITNLHPQMFQDLAQLRVLDLSFNMLTSLHPVMYLSLRNIGTDVSLDGNRWQCDCGMRSLRRWMAYDSSRGLQSWSIVCDSPSILSGRDLLQLNENDLNCFSTENRPELHQDVTVYSGSKILLSCSTQAFILGVLARPLIEVLWRKVTNKKSSSEINAVSVVEETQYDNEAYSSVEDPEETGTHRGRRVTFSTVEFREDSSVSYYDTMDDDEQESINNDPVIECEAPVAEKDKRTEDSGSENSLRQISPKDNQQRDGRERTHNLELEHIPDPFELEERLSSYSDSSLSNKELKEDQMTQGHHTTPKSPQLAEDSVQQTADFSRQVEMPQFSIEDKSEIPGFSSEPFVDWLPHINTTSLTDPELWQENEEELFEFSDSARSSSRFGSFNESISIVAPTSNKQNGGDMSSSSSYLSGDEPSHYTVNSDPEEEEDTEKNNNESEVSFKQIETPDTEVLSLPAAHSSDSSEIEAEIIDLKVKHKKGIVNERIEFNEQETLKTIPQIKKYLDIQDPLPSSDSSSSDESVDETTNHIKKQQETHMERLPIKVSPTVSQDPETQGPALDLEHTTCLKRRLDIKAPSPSPDLSSSSDGQDETTGHTEKQRQETQTLTHDFEQMTRIKRRLDIKAPSPASDLSSSSDSEDETRKHIKKQEQEETLMARPPIKETQTVSHEPETRWPALNLEHIPRIPRRLDIKAPSPASDLLSSSDSEDETTNCIKKQEQEETLMARPPIKETQTVSHEPETRWPTLNLEHIPHIPRRLDIKAPSPASDLLSSSDSEDETTNCIKKQEQEETLMARPPIKETQTVSHEPETWWPTLNLEHIPRIPRRLDIKAPSPASALSISNSEDITTGHTEMQRPDNIDIGGLTFQETQTLTHDLEHMTHIKRHLDIKAPSPASDLSSSSDSEDETRNHIKKQEQEETLMARHPIKETQTVSHEPETRWPTLNLEHIPRIPRRLDIKAPSPASALSSSSNSEDETTGHTETQRPDKIDIGGLIFQETHVERHDSETQWPTFGLENTTCIKRRLDIKAPSPASDLSSSSDSEDETTNCIKKQEQEETLMARPPIKITQTVSHDPETRWPALNLEHIPRIPRRLDIKAPSPASALSSSSNSEDQTTGHTETQRPDKIDIGGLRFQETQVESPNSKTQWPTLDLKQTTHIKRRLDIKAPSPASDLSSSSNSEDEITYHTEKQRPEVGGFAGLPFKKSQPVSHDPGTQWPPVDLGRNIHKRRFDIKAPSPPSDSLSNDTSQDFRQFKFNSSTSDSEDENRDHKAKLSMGASAISKPAEKEFIRSPKTPVINISHSPKTDNNINLVKYTVHTDDLGENTTSDISRTPEINPELQSQWATMDLGFSRFRKNLEITTHEPPNLPSSLPPDSPSFSSSESGIGSKSSRTKQKRGRVMMQRTMPIESPLNPENKPVNVSLNWGRDDNSVEAEDRLKRDYNLPKTEEKSKPDTRLTGTQRVRRNLDIKISDKAPDTPPSSASVSSSENEDESTEHASKGWTGSQNRTSLYVAQTVDINLDQTLSQTEDAEISWMGVSRHLSDLSISKRHLDASLSYPPAKPEHLPPDSSNSSSSESDDKIKQERGKADATSMHKYASLGLSSVSLSSSRALGKFDNSSSNTNEIWRVSPEDRKERKGLSALKAMSSERRKWDTEDKKVDTGTSLYDDHQGDISSIHHRSEEYIKPLVKQSKPELLISSTSANERKASDLLYAIPLYKRHDFEAPQELPPPIPATPPPDED